MHRLAPVACSCHHQPCAPAVSVTLGLLVIRPQQLSMALILTKLACVAATCRCECGAGGLDVINNLSVRAAFQSKQTRVQHVGPVRPSVCSWRSCDLPVAPCRAGCSGVGHVVGVWTTLGCCGLPQRRACAVVAVCSGGCHRSTCITFAGGKCVCWGVRTFVL